MDCLIQVERKIIQVDLSQNDELIKTQKFYFEEFSLKVKHESEQTECKGGRENAYIEIFYSIKVLESDWIKIKIKLVRIKIRVRVKNFNLSKNNFSCLKEEKLNSQ